MRGGGVSDHGDGGCMREGRRNGDHVTAGGRLRDRDSLACWSWGTPGSCRGGAGLSSISSRLLPCCCMSRGYERRPVGRLRLSRSS